MSSLKNHWPRFILKLTSFALIFGQLVSAPQVQAQTSADMALESSPENSPTLFFYRLRESMTEIGSPSIHSETDRLLGNASTVDNSDGNLTPYLNEFQKNLEKFSKINQVFGKLDLFSKDVGNKFVNIIHDDNKLSGYHIHILTKMLSAYHLMSYRTLEFASIYAPANNSRPTQFINLEDLAKTKENLIWLSASMNMYDKLLHAYNIYYKKEGKLRRMLKHIFKISAQTKEVANELKEMTTHSLGKEKRKVLQNYLKRYLERKSELAKAAENDPDLASIMLSIDGSSSLEKIRKGEKIKLKSYWFVDGLAGLGESIVNGLSAFFGNMAGAIRWRHGYLENNIYVADEVRRQLKPLDILFEKTPFALTDTFIPGYFGHAALWLGTEAELREMGMWDHPSIAPYHDQIRQGKSILEALRPGVRLNSVPGFLNIDHLAIMRVKNSLDDKVEVPEIYTRALRSMGKDYDFNFDVATPDKIVCSELMYQAFGKINWPTKPRLGRQTIEPDLVAQVNYYENSPLEFLYFLESFSKTDLQKLREQDLGKRLGFEVNAERSTVEDLSYDQVTTKCRTLIKKRKLQKVCSTKREPLEYKALDLNVSDVNID